MNTAKQKEEWRPVKGFEKNYEVSNLGRVRSVPRLTRWRFGCNYEQRLIPGVVLKPYKNHKGYMMVRLYNDAEQKRRDAPVHRLVMENFVPNPNNLEQVNHKDENKENNCVDNLEWCSNIYNRNYGSSATRSCKPVKQVDKHTHEVIAIYASAQHAQRGCGICAVSIRNDCKGKLKTAGGFKWLYL